MSVPILIPHASGTNRDLEAAQAIELAGGTPTIAHVNELRSGAVQIADHAAILLPGGFSYGDALGAGGRLALELRTWFADELTAAAEASRPMLGICNGFQVLVKAGLLPGPMDKPRSVTLTENAEGKFECRWVTLQVEPSCRSGWLGVVGGTTIRCPIAHGEGRVAVSDDTAAAHLEDGLVAFRYLADGARPASDDPVAAGGMYPANPNGSVNDIAGICDDTGNIVGLMPHPEDHVLDWQRPSGPEGGSGLPLFEAFVAAAR
ncbi:MAG: phosphoribosylformylglycinamidine synthase [Acidimicrobiaceae bacterium]|jgi:phosphoribosylformylglycinamidine synthase|nr:phosphoribosylformylglycinamidine synthase [Acidimicrobiaceae bacterium]HAB56766.1 phosphoribosylformylglycinamidine synthase [Acidimicrobiaceae bacterium]